MWCSLKNGTRTGAVRLNGRTIGSAASGGTERANADCADLYAYLWDNTADAQCPVATGRGATAAADFAANKAITLPSWRGSMPTGFDDMGNTAAGLYAGAPTISGSGILAGSLMGANTHTILEAQLPSHTHTFSATTGAGGSHLHSFSATTGTESVDHTHSGTTSSDGAHTHAVTGGTRGGQSDGVKTAGGDTVPVNPAAITIASDGAHTHTITTGGRSAAHTHNLSGNTGSESLHTHSVSGTSGSTGSGTAHNLMQRSSPVTWFIKL